MATFPPLCVKPGPRPMPLPADTTLETTGSWMWNWQASESQKMEDASLSDPDPSLQPSRPNDLDSPLLTSNMASPVDENGPASLYWPWNPDISQDLASDPWTPELGRNPASGHDNTLCDPGGSFEEWRHIHQTVSMESHPNGEDTSENFGMHIPLVCSLGNEYGIGLSFDHRGPSHDFGLFGPPYTPTKNPISNNSLNETQRAGYALLAAHSGQPLHNSRLPDGARSYRIQNLDNEPRASDSSASTGEMFFDSNMEKVQPRKLKKKTIEERESYLNVRRRGGACRRHKLTKRACRCKPESDSSTLPSQTSDGSPREKRRKVDAEVGTPQRQSIASGTPDNSPSLDGSVHDHTQTDHSFPTACKPTGLLASGSVVSPGAFGSRANAKMTNLSLVPNDTLIFACPYPLTGCRFLSLTCSELSAHIDMHRRRAAKDTQDVQGVEP